MILVFLVRILVKTAIYCIFKVRNLMPWALNQAFILRIIGTNSVSIIGKITRIAKKNAQVY